ncbi:MAG: hypothetical protein ABIY55_13110 [Kofleriaceae bacterium]
MRSLVLGDLHQRHARTWTAARLRAASRRAGAWCGVAVLISCVGLATAGDTGAASDTPETTLGAKDLQHYFAPYVPGVRTCYLANARSKAADGTLRLELIVHPSGSIYKFGFAAPGVDPPWLGKLDACLRKLALTWHLPVRTRFTTAVLPFLFVKTTSPGAGPIESCWDPRGCPPGKSGGAK